MKDTKKRRYNGLRISRVLLVSVIKIGIPVVFGIFVFVELFSIVEKKKIQAQEALILEDVLTVEDEQEISYDDNLLLEDNYPELNKFFEDYYGALATGDTDLILSLQDSLSDTDKITIEKKSEYIDEYDNIKVYTKKGLDDDSYVVFTVSDVKFTGVDATAPAMTVYYAYLDENGQRKVQGDMSEDVLSILPNVYSDPDVIDLFNKVDASFTEAVTNDEPLNTFLVELPALLKNDVGEALALLEASETNEISEGEVAMTCAVETNVLSGEVQEANPVFQVIAIDTVNVRKSDSEKADKIGKVNAGQELTCLEEKINGWSKILYEGKEAYIKSTYLEKVKSAADGEVIGVVKALSNVNVRMKASQDSAKLGVANTGSAYNLLEDLGEWYHIDYNGKNGYVKAEYFSK